MHYFLTKPNNFENAVCQKNGKLALHNFGASVIPSFLFLTTVFLGFSANGAQLYQVHRSGQIWEFTGVPCRGSSCTGWQKLFNESQVPPLLSRRVAQQLTAGNQALYQLHQLQQIHRPNLSGAISRYTKTPCLEGVCPGWEMLDNNASTKAIDAAGDALYQLHEYGDIWRFTGAPCSGNRCRGWERLDNNRKTIAIEARPDALYQMHNDGSIWRFNGTPCIGDRCRGWYKLDNNRRTKAIEAAGNALYQLHDNGNIWRYTGTPCFGDRCRGWVRLDNNRKTKAIKAAGRSLYQLHEDGAIWRFTGEDCSGDRCRGWQRLDNNPKTKAIEAAGDALYQLHDDGGIWRFTGTPCSGTRCRGWERLDNNRNTLTLVAAPGELQTTSEPLNVDLRVHFGYRGANARGVRPLLVVLLNAPLPERAGFNPTPTPTNPSNPVALNTVAAYRRLIFGPGFPNIADYYREISGGLFSWREAGILGPINVPPGTTLSQRYRLVKRFAANSGFNFANFDDNRNGRVSDFELGILMIDNYSAGGGQTNQDSCVNASRVDVCTDVSAAGAQSSLINFAHELGHQLDQKDRYLYDLYSSLCFNPNATLMACTGGGNTPPNPGIAFHLDPWHKMKVGWLEPKVFSVRGPGTCQTLNHPAIGTDSRYPEGVILVDPRRGANEYYFLEYRSNTLSRNTYDQNAPDQGLAIWYIQTDADKNLRRIVGRLRPGADGFLDSANNLRGDDLRGFDPVSAVILPGPNGIVDTPNSPRDSQPAPTDVLNFLSINPAQNRPVLGIPVTFFKQNSGTVRPLWFDRSPIGVRIRVGAISPPPTPSNPTPPSSPRLSVEWDNGQSFAPQIDRSRTASSISPGSVIVLDGVFGVQQAGRRPVLMQGDRVVDLSAETWSCERIGLRVPATIDPGDYELVIFNDRGGSKRSIAIAFSVRN